MLAPIPAGIPQYAKGGPIPQGPLQEASIGVWTKILQEES